MSSKNSFKLFYDSLDVLDDLTDEQAGQLFKAIREYEISSKEVLSGLMKAIFVPFKNHIDRNKKKYEEVCERNKANGLKGGRPKAEETQNNPVGSFETHSNPKKADKDKDKDKDKKEKKKPATPRVSSERKEILELKPFYFSKEQWEELYTHRTKRKATQTPRAYSNLITEFDKAHASGMSADEILNAMSTGKGWAGFKLEWVRNNNGDQIKPRTVSDANSIRKEEMCGRLLEGLGGIFDENETGRINH